jgi:DNA polymerase-3 subunit delta'
MPFSSIVGHQRPIADLQHAIRADRVHHAWLFAGPAGVGKRLVARTFAKALLCVHNNADACDACTHCLRIEQDQHPDVSEILPDTSKTRPTIKIDQIREITRQVSFKPFEGRRRVILIDGAEAMTEEASNALLKTLEEPTGDTLFLLLTPQDRQLLPTIRSRCQLLRFGPLPRADVHRLLLQRDVHPDTATVAAAFSDGSLGAALLLSLEGALDQRRALVQSAAELEPNDPLAAFQVAQLWTSSGANLVEALDWLRTFYRDVALTAAGADPDRIINVDLRPAVARAARELTLEATLGHIDRINAAARDLRAYVDARLVLENLMLALADRA